MVDDESADWWKTVEYRPITFEERITQVMIPGMNATGLNPERKPDLIILSSLFWDENYIGEVSDSETHCMASRSDIDSPTFDGAVGRKAPQRRHGLDTRLHLRANQVASVEDTETYPRPTRHV